jgi:zinc/manganese transport system permease protein
MRDQIKLSRYPNTKHGRDARVTDCICLHLYSSVANGFLRVFASSRSPLGIFLVSALTVALFGLVQTSTAAPTTVPTNSVDRNTQDVLSELDQSSGGAPATLPANSARADKLAEERSDGPRPALQRATQSDFDVSLSFLISQFRYMLATAAALGIAGGIVGFFVLLRREALVALAIPQVVAVGAAIGMRLEWPTLPPALGTAVIALVYFAFARRWAASNWIVPSFYIAGLCLSFLIIANHGQDVEELQHLFVGFDVAVTKEQAVLAVPILLIVAITCAMLWRRWLLLAQAPAAAELAGLHPARWDTCFLALLTLILLLGTQALGVVMVLAMLFLPAATVLPWAQRIPAALAASALLSLLFLAGGFYLSNHMNWPFSQSIGGVGFAALFLSHVAAQFRGGART